jgi:glutamine amidotransferase
MCRILAYLGPELPLENLLLKPTNSLIHQSKAPAHHPLLQLAGWGFGAWSETFNKPERPLIYRRAAPAFFDDNTTTVIPPLRAHTVLAHVRASTYRSETVITHENCHPFSYQGTRWSIVHNGSLPGWRLLQRELLPFFKDEFLSQMRGTTDTEFLYGLFLSLLEDDSPDGFQTTIERVLQLILQSMKKLGITKPTKLKLAFATEGQIVGVNFGSGFDGETDIAGDLNELRKAKVGSREFLLSTILEPLWVISGRNFHKYEDSYRFDLCGLDEATAAILASEPLTAEEDDWMVLEFGKMMVLKRQDDRVCIEVRDLNL